uniref:Uncharacterized protein n=1 Tax=Fibrocapsa japonica TaxID=94617 RepID=A0A7S2UTD0_9STRA
MMNLCTFFLYVPTLNTWGPLGFLTLATRTQRPKKIHVLGEGIELPRPAFSATYTWSLLSGLSCVQPFGATSVYFFVVHTTTELRPWGFGSYTAASTGCTLEFRDQALPRLRALHRQ